MANETGAPGSGLHPLPSCGRLCEYHKAANNPPPDKLRTEDEIVRYYWPKDMGEPAPWFRAAVSDAYDTGIAFAVRRSAERETEGRP